MFEGFTRKKSASLPADRRHLLDEMTAEAKKTVKHYFSDWTDYDVPVIEKLEPDMTEYIWILRECGTYFFPLDHYESTRSVLNCYGPENVKVYGVSIGPGGCSLIWLKNPAEFLKDAEKHISEKESAKYLESLRF